MRGNSKDRYFLLSILGFIFLFLQSSIAAAKIWVPIDVGDIFIVVPVDQQWSVSPGTADPGPLCSQQINATWKDIFCNFLTQAQFNAYYQRTGKAYYYPSYGNSWQPFYNNEGLLEYLKQPWTGGQVRYTPWSQRLNSPDPYPLAWSIQGNTPNYCVNGIDRSCILSFGFSEFVVDANDPTQNFENGILGYFLNMVEAYRIANGGASNLRPSWVYDLNNLARTAVGGSFENPDWIFDGATFLICPSSNTAPCNSAFSMQLPALEQASDLAAKYKLVFANGSLSNIADAENIAKEIANRVNRPIVYMYHAQDANYWRPLGDTKFMQIFQELVTLTQHKAKSAGSNIEYVCHSNAVYKCAIATFSYDNAILLGVNPAHEKSASQNVWLSTSQSFQGQLHILAGYDDFISHIWTKGVGFMDANLLGQSTLKGSQEVYSIVQNKSNVFEEVWHAPGFDHLLLNMLNATIGYDYYGTPKYGWDYLKTLLPTF